MRLCRLVLYLAVGFAVSYALATVSSAAKLGVINGRCHMDYCTFTKLLSVTAVSKSKLGTLLAVLVSSVTIKAPLDAEGMPRYEALKAPEKYPPPGMPSYVFCSKRKPLVAFWTQRNVQLGIEEGWYAHLLLIGNPDGLFGFNLDSHAIYWAVCHDVFLAGVDELYSDAIVKRARALKYRPEWPNSGDQITFKSLEEVYRYLDI